ncbi:MAG: NAD(P)H-hydrate dehydratase, partial [Gammaproteobacteria bacterium]
MTRAPDVLTEAALRAWPLPEPDPDGDKEERGRTLVIAGGPELAGAALLSGTAALRAGAGKLQIATTRSVAASLALAVPEALVIGLPETAGGGLGEEGAALLASMKVDSLLIGPGLQDEAATVRFVRALLPTISASAIVLDAFAMAVVGEQHSFRGPVLLTPHAGEMAKLTNTSKEDVLSDPASAALDAARAWNATVALKGSVTWIATPQGRLWCHDGGNVGLGTSGSGDVLAGVIAGLAARGAPLEQAAAWGVALHAKAGEMLADRL